MACIHLQRLFELCQEHDLRFQLSSSDLVRIVCHECGDKEVCPSVLTDEYDDKPQPQLAERPETD